MYVSIPATYLKNDMSVLQVLTLSMCAYLILEQSRSLTE